MCTICTRSIPAMSKGAAWTRWWQWNIMSTVLWNNASVRNMTADRCRSRALMDPSRNCSLHKKDWAWRLCSPAELEKLVIYKKNLLWCYSAHLSMNGKFFGLKITGLSLLSAAGAQKQAAARCTSWGWVPFDKCQRQKSLAANGRMNKW